MHVLCMLLKLFDIMLKVAPQFDFFLLVLFQNHFAKNQADLVCTTTWFV